MDTRNFAIFTDAFANLPGQLLKALDIQILPCTYFVDGQPVHYNGDIETFDVHGFYDSIRQGRVITTALVNSETFLQCFRPAAEAGLDIFYVGLSSGVSGTYQAAVMAGQELMEEFPGSKVRTVDSLGAGLGLGLLACRAADLRAEGKTLDETADTLEQEKLGLCEFFTVESLEYLKRSGRVSAATAAIGSVLNIKPLLYGDYHGHIVSCAKHRGRKKVVAAMLEKYQKLAKDPENCRVFISHGDCLEEAQQLAQQISTIAAPKELHICPHEPFTGCHVGPGMLGLFFMGTARLD